MWWVWRWLLLTVALTATTGLPVPDEIIDTSTKLLGSSVVTSVSVVMGHEDENSNNESEKSDTRKVTEDLPPSTVDMLKPDGFQFYTVDEKGQLITRQMTDAEIQSIIAAGGGPFPIEAQDPQKMGDNLTEEMKVADVVQNVQNVLNGELSKPAMAIGTVPTIPGHANDEWSSILPSILGGETESAPVTLTGNDDKPMKEIVKQNVSSTEIPATSITSLEKLPVNKTPVPKPEETESPVTEKTKPTVEEDKTDEMVKIDKEEILEDKKEPEKTEETTPKDTERPMIQVPVITAGSVQSTTKDPAVYEEKPVYQILNTISADEVKDEEVKPVDTEPEKTANSEKESPDSSSGIISATEKIENEVKEPEVVQELPTTTAKTLETMIEMEVTSSFVPAVQEEPDKLGVSSGLKETEEVKPAVDTQKLEKPSINLEAPLADEKEVQNIPEVKPTVTEEDKKDKIPVAVDEALSIPSQQTETTTLAATIGEEVSEMINLIPESISTIVDELISESSIDVPEQVIKDGIKSDDTETSVDNNDQKKQETSSTEDRTKIQDSKNKTDDSNPSVIKVPDSSDAKVTLASEIPVTEAETIFQIMPEIIPDSNVTKTAVEAPAISENVGNKPETIETVSEPTKIVTEETATGDKIEQQTGTEIKSETTQSSIPVSEAAASVTTVTDNVTDKNETVNESTLATVEKKPETLLTELADSVSSMISQVSEIMPSMVPIPQNSETKEPPVKRVEDGVKGAETSTVRSEDLPSTVTIASEETTKPLIPADVELPTKEKTTKPMESEPEIVMVEVKTPEPTTTISIIDDSDTTKSSEPVSTELPESSITTNDKLDASKIVTTSESSNDVKKTEASISEDEKPQQVEDTTTDSKATEVSESDSDKEMVKLEEPEKIEAVVKDETKSETDSDVEAPIVRIDITEPKPTVSAVKNDDSTESSVVRIQLTNTVSTINQIIDSAPETVSPVSVQEISFPDKNVLEPSSAGNIGSSLIAGAQPSSTTEIKTPEDLPQVDATVSAVGDEAIQVPSPTETANIDSDIKTPLKSDAEASSKDKTQPEIENTKIPVVEVAQITTETKPVVNDESPKPVTEITKTIEKSDETKVEKPSETQNSKDTIASVDKDALSEQIPVKPVVEINPPVSVDEKIESTTKNDIEKIPAQIPEKIFEPVTIVSGEKIEQKDAPQPVNEPAEIPTVKDTPIMIPSEVVVSTTVDVQPIKESPEKVKGDTVEPLKSEEKADEKIKTKITPESVDTLENIPEKKPEADNNATKISNTPNESTQNLVSVELATSAPTQPDLQLSDQVPEISTSATASGDNVADKTEAQEVIEPPTTAQTDTKVQSSGSTDKKTEMPDVKTELPVVTESGDASQAVKQSIESVAKPELIKTEDPKSPSSEGEAETKIPSVTSPAQGGIKESSVSDAVENEQTSVPLVRIDVTPEKNQPVSSMTKIEKIPDSTKATEMKSEKPSTPTPTEISTSQEDEPLKKSDKPKDDSAVKTSGTKPVESETIVSSLESSTKAPAMSDIEETKVQLPAVIKEPEVVAKPTEESVKETAVTVNSKLPEVTVSVETTSSANPTATKIENEVTTKPEVKIDTTSNNATNNTPDKTQEIRIQVNDTAVLVTKQKIPQKVDNEEKKVLPTEIPDPKFDKVEVSSQPPEIIEVLIEPTKIPSVQKPIPITNSQETDATTSKQDADKVKPESTSQQKKPTADPYTKLGEKKQEQKPVDPNVLKTQVLANKKPENPEGNKPGDDKWTLIPQSEPYPILKQQSKPLAEVPSLTNKNEDVSVPLEAHHSAVSLDESTRHQDEDISNFSKLCNELAFSFWIAANKGLSTARSLALSPFGMTSMLAMVFLGARGPTSGQMNDILKLDDVVTFNPHLVFQNVSDSVNLARGQGIANAAFVRELFADRLKAGRLLPFYKERAQQFYDGHVEEVNFATISDLVRRRTNLLIRRQTGGRIRDFVKGNVMPLRSPLAALSANVFQTDCTGASSEGRDGEMYFAVLPAVRQRKLVPVPATVWRSGVLAGYEPGLDATVISLGGVGNLVSTIFILPGQQGLAAPGDSLDHLEKRLLEGAFTNGVWDRLIRVLIPRMGLEVQVPKFSHRSVVNATAALKRMGLDDLFSRHADLKGINGIGNDLHLADMLQINLFSTCGDEVITGGRHHVEIYPASPLRGARINKKVMESEEGQEETEPLEDDEKEERTRRSLNVGEYIQLSRDLDKRSTSLPAEKQLIPDDKDDDERSQRSSINSKELLQLSKGKQNERPLLKLDRPFLYFVRHNPTGMILHMGRFNPRLMP